MHEYDFFCNYMRVESCRKKEATKVLILCGLIAVLLAYSVSAPFVAYVIRLEKSDERTIVIDAGHGGDIRASSAEGKGTTFEIELPLQQNP